MDLKQILREEIENIQKILLYHVTSCSVAENIKISGFKPVKNKIGYKYYSELGENGIYFYQNLRQIQNYAYFFKNKIGNNICLIKCEAPSNIIQKTDKLEDGLFISIDNLSKIKILSIYKINDIKDLY